MNIPKPILDQIEWDDRKDEPEHYRVKRLKPCTAPCNDCGDAVCDRSIIVKLHQSPYPHWRTRCLTCKRVKNPITGVFDVTDAGANQFYRSNQQKITRKD
jgi:hypothetical protein